MSEMYSVSRNEYGDNEIDLTAIVKTMWGGRWRITVMAVAASLLALSFNAARWLSPGDKIEYSIVIELPFRNADSGNYPNGAPFSISDLVAASVLQVVHERADLESYGLGFQNFSENVGVKPEAIDEDFISQRFKTKLGQKSLTSTEIESLESEYAAALKSSSNRFARIFITLPANTSIPLNVVERILYEIPMVWSDISITQRGVLDIPITSANAFEVGDFQREEYALVLERVKGYTLQIQKNLDEMLDIPATKVIRDVETGVSPLDLRLKVADFIYYQLEPLRLEVIEKGFVRDYESGRLYFDTKLRELISRKDEVMRKAELYESALAQVANGQRTIARQDGVATAPVAAEFLDRMLGIGGQLSEIDFKQVLITKRIELLTESEEYSTQINEIRHRLNAFEEHNNQPKPSTEVVGDIETKLADMIARFEKLKTDYSALHGIARDALLESRSTLYRTAPASMKILDESTIATRSFLIILLFAAIAGTMAGVALHLVLIALRVAPRADNESEYTVPHPVKRVDTVTR